MYKEFSFLKVSRAKKKAKVMKEKYGYKPEVFKVTHPVTKKSKYVVVKPKGLKKIKW